MDHGNTVFVDTSSAFLCLQESGHRLMRIELFNGNEASPIGALHATLGEKDTLNWELRPREGREDEVRALIEASGCGFHHSSGITHYDSQKPQRDAVQSKGLSTSSLRLLNDWQESFVILSKLAPELLQEKALVESALADGLQFRKKPELAALLEGIGLENARKTPNIWR